MDMVCTSIAFFLVYHTKSSVKRQKPSRFDFFLMGILASKGGRNMKLSGLAITAGLGAAAGAVAVMMMPRQNPARKLAAKAANKVEDVVWKMEDKMNWNMDM
jgi:hypothetical protein